MFSSLLFDLEKLYALIVERIPCWMLLSSYNTKVSSSLFLKFWF